MSDQIGIEALERYAAVVNALGGQPKASGLAVKVSCPLHEGDGQSLQVQVGKKGFPLLHCFGECEEEWETDNNAWLKKVRAAIVLLGVPELNLKPRVGRQPAKRSDEPSDGTGEPLPEAALVSKWHKRLCEGEELKANRIFLSKVRGLNKETILRAELGKHYKRFTIPVRDAAGRLLNVRKYDPRANGHDKMIGVKGHNAPCVYPSWALEDSGDKPILWTEGELDALLANQRSDGQYVAVTGTGGAGSPPRDLSAFAGRSIYVVFDCDRAGREGARRLALQLLAAHAETVHVVDLGLSEGEDITDWFVKHLESVEDLWSLCERSPAFDPDVC